MSIMHQMIFSGRGLVNVSGTVSGSGSVSIPAGVTSLSLLGQGGAGTTTNDPGQPYIAPTSGTSAELTYNSLYFNGAYQSYSTTFPNTLTRYTAGSVVLGSSDSSYPYSTASAEYPALPSSIQITSGPFTGEYLSYTSGNTYRVNNGTTVFNYNGTYSVDGYTQLTGAIYTLMTSTGTDSNPGQPYVAPSSSSNYGPTTTIVFQGIPRSWQGNYGAGYPAAFTQTISGLTGAAGSMTYDCAPGTSLTYSYFY